MGGISNSLTAIADVCSGFENLGPEAAITDARPLEQDLLETGSISLEIGVEMPFLDTADVSQGTEITLKQAELTAEGKLRFTCLAQAFPEDSALASSPQASQIAAATSKTSTTVEEAGKESAEDEYDEEDLVHEDAEEHSDEQPIEEVGLKGGNNEQVEENLQSDETEVPPYQDPEKLREVYDKYETFSEMTDALGVDVTSQTVRRYMIKHDIHQSSPRAGSSSISTLIEADPDSFPLKSEENEKDNAQDDDSIEMTQSKEKELEDEDAEITEEQVETTLQVSQDGGTTVSTADEISEQEAAFNDQDWEKPASEIIDKDIDIPDSLTIAEIKEAVNNANTLYDVEQEIDIDRKKARDLLQNLNLLDLVHGRLSTRDFQRKTIDEINNRIQSAVRKTD